MSAEKVTTAGKREDDDTTLNTFMLTHYQHSLRSRFRSLRSDVWLLGKCGRRWEYHPELYCSRKRFIFVKFLLLSTCKIKFFITLRTREKAKHKGEENRLCAFLPCKRSLIPFMCSNLHKNSFKLCDFMSRFTVFKFVKCFFSRAHFYVFYLTNGCLLLALIMRRCAMLLTFAHGSN